jgi:hypothetical protein
MAPETIFQICNTIALTGWIVLIFLPFWKHSDHFIIGILVTLFCMVYAWMILRYFNLADRKSFGSLQGVMELFQHPGIVVAGWVHYLAFDLLAGVFIKKNAVRHNISHWLLVPCLLLAFMLGPAGLLLYLLIRLIKTKRYFTQNF